MTAMEIVRRIGPRGQTALKAGVVIVALLILTIWLALTPPGILGKADAIGYAVCHRIELRSFWIGDRPTPLCARCSGMYLGMLTGFIFQWVQGKRGGLPPLRISIPLSIFLITFGVDGLNSYLHFFPQAPTLYQPSNLLRLATGSGLGLLVAVIFLPLFNQYFWTEPDPRPALANYRQVGLLLFMVGLVATVMFLQIPGLITLLAILSAATVWLVLGMCYTLLWMTVFQRENSFSSLKSGWLLLTMGFTTALIQIGAVDWLRYTLTGTWSGFTF